MAKKDKKPVVGFYGLTGCAGCLLSFIFNENEIVSLLGMVDLAAFPFIKGKQGDKEFDIIFLEGVVCSNDDLDMLKKLRAKTKILVSLGACASTGCIPAYRNFIDEAKYLPLMYEKVHRIKDKDPKPIDAYVHVDFTIPGCPPNREEVKSFIKQLILGKTPRLYNDPVCVECKLNGNHCLLDEGKICLGPITRGGCDSVCTNGRFECWGCRGPCPDANYEAFIALIKDKGHNSRTLKERMQSFAGLKLPDELQIEDAPDYVG